MRVVMVFAMMVVMVSVIMSMMVVMMAMVYGVCMCVKMFMIHFITDFCNRDQV